MRCDGGGQDDEATAAHMPALCATDFDLMFRQGMALVTAVATRLRQPALPGTASLDNNSPQIRIALLAQALELNTALQLLRSAREGHLPPEIARREIRLLLNRLASAQLMTDEASETGEDALHLPVLLRLPAHQLASLEAALRPHLTLLAEETHTGTTRARPSKTRHMPHRPTRQSLHLVPGAD